MRSIPCNRVTITKGMLGRWGAGGRLLRLSVAYSSDENREMLHLTDLTTPF